MKKTKIEIVCLVLMASLFPFTGQCQLAPPKQVDTLAIMEMFYNNDVVDKINWPFDYVIKTPTSFTFGNQVINVKYDYKSPFTGNVYKDQYYNELSYRIEQEYISISYSGYFLKCTPLRVVKEDVIEKQSKDDIAVEVEDYTEKSKEWSGIEDAEIPYEIVEQKPLFRGGDANAFSKWVGTKLVYPEIAKENGVQGRVLVSFTIKADGSVANVKVSRRVDPALDKEAVRVVSSSPKWKPGKQKGQPVNVTYFIPVIFQLR